MFVHFLLILRRARDFPFKILKSQPSCEYSILLLIFNFSIMYYSNTMIKYIIFLSIVHCVQIIYYMYSICSNSSKN